MNSLRKKLSGLIVLMAVLIVPAHPAMARDQNVSVRTALSSLSLLENNEALLSALDGQRGTSGSGELNDGWDPGSSDYRDFGYSKKDLKYLSAIIYCEANSMSHDAKVAVANVILNRLYYGSDKDWGHLNSIYDVIYDRKWGVQFSPTSGKSPAIDRALALYSSMDPDKYHDWQIEAMTNCIKAAKDALCGYKAIPDNFLYFNGYIEKSKKACQDRGSAFVIMDRHIYFTIETE